MRCDAGQDGDPARPWFRSEIRGLKHSHMVFLRMKADWRRAGGWGVCSSSHPMGRLGPAQSLGGDWPEESRNVGTSSTTPPPRGAIAASAHHYFQSFVFCPCETCLTDLDLGSCGPVRPPLCRCSGALRVANPTTNSQPHTHRASSWEPIWCVGARICISNGLLK